MNHKHHILFVCLGNICRSPAAEGIFRKMVNDGDLSDRFVIDSCGTIDHHQGEMADPRMREHARKRGYDLQSRSRPIKAEDFERFDHIIVMDDSNSMNVKKLTDNKEHHKKVKKITDFCQKHHHREVPDPYWGGAEGFDLVIDLLEDGCSHLLTTLK